MANDAAGRDTRDTPEEPDQPRTPVAADPDASPLEPPATGLGKAGSQGELAPLKDAATSGIEGDEP